MYLIGYTICYSKWLTESETRVKRRWELWGKPLRPATKTTRSRLLQSTAFTRWSIATWLI